MLFVSYIKQQISISNSCSILLIRTAWGIIIIDLLLSHIFKVDLTFQTGRVDCATAPYTDADVQLPGPHLTYAGKLYINQIHLCTIRL